ncbi:hypothetical protein R5W24_002752, partial [Gemmata sp. JC717]|uniref:hypothetical protein n=1 Tax=Gemmata algarum TaxID=2975278 RepID=UPI0021BAD746
DPRYKTFNDSPDYCLYKHLRCGMAHLLRPQGKVAFTNREQALKDGNAHLVVNPQIDKLVLVAERFSDDFATACRALIPQLPELAKRHPKLNEPYLMLHSFEQQ